MLIKKFVRLRNRRIIIEEVDGGFIVTFRKLTNRGDLEENIVPLSSEAFDSLGCLIDDIKRDVEMKERIEGCRKAWDNYYDRIYPES